MGRAGDEKQVISLQWPYSTRRKFLLVQKHSLLHLQTYCILKNTEKFPSSLPRHSQALVRKFFTLSRGLTVFGSLEPSPRALLFPLGGELQSTLRLRVRSEAFGAFSASRIDTEGRRSDDLAWSWGTASLQQSSIAVGAALTATDPRGAVQRSRDYSTFEKSVLLFKTLFANN